MAQNRSSGDRIGIDLGGTKIAGICLDRNDRPLAEYRMPTPRNDYSGTLQAIANVVSELETSGGSSASIGIGIPGSIASGSGCIQNANATWLNGTPFVADLTGVLQREIRCANDANCFILSEYHDGAAAGTGSAFGVILGTGCGGGVMIDGTVHHGHRRIGGEWGHTPLPWPTARERPGPTCWCGRSGCLETWISGPGLVADHARETGENRSAEEIVALARTGDTAAQATLQRHVDRLARGLAVVVNLLDPAAIVLGGGLSDLDHLYDQVPTRMAPFIFADDTSVSLRRPAWGATSGARGAARLWDI